MWSDEIKALKLLTLLEGEALVTWLALDEEDQKTFEETKTKMIKILSPTEFMTQNQFHQRKLAPGEPLLVFIYEQKKLLRHAMPNVLADVPNQLLLYQLLGGLPMTVRKTTTSDWQDKRCGSNNSACTTAVVDGRRAPHGSSSVRTF